MSDYETTATSWDYWDSTERLSPAEPNRPDGPGWRLVHVVETVNSGVIGYWEREVKS